MPNKKEKLVIIDGNALIHRGFHALPQNLRTTDGRLVNGVYGFTTTLLNVMRELSPEYFIVTFDKKGKVFRHEKYPEYKAKRMKAPQELYDQIPIVKEVVKAMSIPAYEMTGYEADDIIGSLSREIEVMNKKNGTRIESYIVTGDNDTLQLVDANTKIYKLKKGFSESEIYDVIRVKNEFGFGPEYMVDYRGLKGDPSDNIPGVPGIGEKTALKIIQHFKTLENLKKALDTTPIDGKLDAGDFVIKGKTLRVLKEHWDKAELSREISTIVCDLKVPIDLKKSTLANYDRSKVIEMFQTLQFKSLLKRLPAAEEAVEEIPLSERGASSSTSKKKKSKESEGQITLFQSPKKKIVAHNYEELAAKANYKAILTEKDLDMIVKRMYQTKEFAIDTETSALSPMNSSLVGISLCFKKGEAFYIPVGHTSGKGLPRTLVLEKLREPLEDAKLKKIGQNIKYDYVVLLHHGIEMRGLSFDTLLAAYMLNPGERGLNLDRLAFVELGYEMMPITDLIGTGKHQKSFADVPVDAATFYSAEDAEIAFLLKHIFEKRLSKDLATKKIFEKIEMPLITVLGHMEYNGVCIDPKYLKKVSVKFSKQIQSLTEKIYREAGIQFNISSTQQLSRILFEKLKISTQGIAHTQTGFSTAASELTKLKGQAKIIDHIAEYRELTKLKNTYLDALPQLVHPETGRLHTTYSQTIAATGRLSSNDPNLQNIPIRTESGREIRGAFYAKKGSSFLALDYSQIELRIMAHLSKDDTFVKAFKENQDIHATVAAQIHNKKIDEVTPEERREAKIINFAILYGAGARGLSQQTTMNYAEAKEYVERYFELHPKIRATIDLIKKKAHEDEYVESLYGRKRLVPDINASHQMIRAGSERAAINMPFQGTNADIIKMAMLKLVDEMPELEDLMLLQVHDELIFEIPDAQIRKYAKKIRDVMQTIVKLSVPLKVDVEAGKRWSDLEKLEI